MAITTPKEQIHPIIATAVNNHPFPILTINGSAITPPAHEQTFLTKLLTATPLLLLRGIYSVSMVVETPNIIMLPRPKKKLIRIGTGHGIAY